MTHTARRYLLRTYRIVYLHEEGEAIAKVRAATNLHAVQDFRTRFPATLVVSCDPA